MAVPLIKIENARGEVLDLSADPRYVPILTGTAPPAATINRAKVAVADGTRFNSSTVGERNLLLTIYLVRDIARARLNLYRYIATKQYIKVYYTADDLEVSIEGYVETAELDPWTQDQNMAVSIICPQPFWQALTETCTNASNVDKLLEFPFAIESEGVELSTVDSASSTEVANKGTVETGLRFEIVATIRSLQPRIYNLETGEYMGFYVDLLDGERLVIDTTQGRKSVTLISNGVESNYIHTLMEGSTWLQLPPGNSTFSYTMDEGEAELYIYHTNKYIGV